MFFNCEQTVRQKRNWFINEGKSCVLRSLLEAAARERRRGWWRSGVTGPRRSTRPPSTAMDPQKPSEESDIKYWGNGKRERVGRVLVIDTAKWAVGRRGSVERLTHHAVLLGVARRRVVVLTSSTYHYIVQHNNATIYCKYKHNRVAQPL